MPTDPYQPPGTSSPPVYPVVGIVLATLIGSLIAGVFMLYRNYQVLGYPGLARKTAMIGGAVFLVIFGIAAALPAGLPQYVASSALQTLIAWFGARQLQGAAIDHHVAHGGTAFGIGYAIIVGIGVSLLAAAVIALVAMVVISLSGGA